MTVSLLPKRRQHSEEDHRKNADDRDNQPDDLNFLAIFID